MELAEFIALADAYAKLGSAVQEQLKSVVDDEDSVHDQNPNALQLIKRFACNAADSLDADNDADFTLVEELTELAMMLDRRLNPEQYDG